MHKSTAEHHQLRQVSTATPEQFRRSSFSRDEMNLAEFPLTVLSTRVNPALKTLEFRDTIRSKNGELTQRSWILTGADKFGLPTSTDDDVVLGLIRLTINNGFRNPKVFFTRYELLKILRWSTEGRSYTRLTRSLDRLSGVRVKATNAFYDNNTKTFQTCNFGIVDAYEINDERGSRHQSTGEPPKSFFIWSDVLFESFRAGFIKKLDMELYFGLRSAISRRLYRYLDKHFYYTSSLERQLMTFAFEKLGLSRSYQYISSVKQQIEPALEELKSVGFLSGYEFSGRGAATVIRCHSAKSKITRPTLLNRPERSGEKQEQFNFSKLQKGGNRELFQALQARGITSKQITKLLRAKTDNELEQIRLIILYYDHLLHTGDSKISRSKVGFLYRAVENPFKFSIPQWFLNKQIGEKRTQKSSYRRNIRTDKTETEATQSNSLYQAFIEAEVTKLKSTMPQTELTNIYRSVEVKMGALKSVLENSMFQQALEGCVQDEIAKRAGLPDFRFWKKARNNS